MQNTSRSYFFKRSMKSKFIWGVLTLLFVTISESFSQQAFYAKISNPVSPLYQQVSGDFSIKGDGIVIGAQSVNSDSGILVFKIDYSGNPGFKILLNRNFGTNPFPINISQLFFTTDSLITILANDNGFPLIIKLSQAGVLNDAKKFTQGDITILRLKEIDGFLYGLGSCNNTSQSGCIVKMDLNGNIIGTYALNNNFTGRVLSFFEMIKAPDGGFFIAGEHSFPNQVPLDKLVLMKTDSSFILQWQKHFTTDSVLGTNDMIPAGMTMVAGGNIMMLVRSSANCCTKIILIDSLGNFNSSHEFKIGAGFSNAFFHKLHSLSSGNILTGGHLYSNTQAAYYPCSVELNAAGDLVRFIAYQSDSSFGYFESGSTAYKEGNGILICGRQSTGIGKNRIVVYDTDSLMEMECLDSAIAITKVIYTAHDSLFSFSLVPVTRTNVSYSASIGSIAISLTEELNCVPVGLMETYLDESDFEIYPNPANSELVIQLNEIHDSNSSIIRMYSLTGSLVFENTVINEKTTIDVSFLPAGFYYIQVKAISGMSTKKVVLVR